MPDYFARRERVEAFDDVAIFSYTGRNVGEREAPRRVFTLGVSHSFLPALRVDPILGRNFTVEEEFPENGRVVILGYEVWQNRYGGDSNVIGQMLRVNEEPSTIIGVTLMLVPVVTLYSDESW